MVTDLFQPKRTSEILPANTDFVGEAKKRGAIGAKIIRARTIALGNWTRLKCQFGCPHFGRLHTCPTFTPTTQEMSDILMDYDKALVVEANDSSKVHELVLGLEIHYKALGFSKAFALEARPCELCEVCTVETHCEYPEQARPTMQGCGIDVSKTLTNIGWKMASAQEPCSVDQTVGIVLLD